MLTANVSVWESWIQPWPNWFHVKNLHSLIQHWNPTNTSCPLLFESKVASSMGILNRNTRILHTNVWKNLHSKPPKKRNVKGWSIKRNTNIYYIIVIQIQIRFENEEFFQGNLVVIPSFYQFSPPKKSAPLASRPVSKVAESLLSLRSCGSTIWLFCCIRSWKLFQPPEISGEIMWVETPHMLDMNY